MKALSLSHTHIQARTRVLCTRARLHKLFYQTRENLTADKVPFTSRKSLTFSWTRHEAKQPNRMSRVIMGAVVLTVEFLPTPPDFTSSGLLSHIARACPATQQTPSGSFMQSLLTRASAFHSACAMADLKKVSQIVLLIWNYWIELAEVNIQPSYHS